MVTYLKVPFEEKDNAKRLGARWDYQKKIWYAQDNADLSQFEKWIPEKPHINIRSTNYFIAESHRSCWKCSKKTKIVGFLLPALHETLEPIEEEEAGFGSDDKFDEKEFEAWLNSPASSRWVKNLEARFCQYLISISDTVIAHMKKFTDIYQLDFSKTIQNYYWMNHCEYCKMKQGDYEIYEEPKGAFCPKNAQEASQIQLTFINEYFEASGGVSYDQELFQKMSRI